MIEFVDRTGTQAGTPLNRSSMMAIQGFLGTRTIFNIDGSIIEINDNGDELTTVFNEDGSITETFSGEKTITKKTTFDLDGNITEVLS